MDLKDIKAILDLMKKNSVTEFEMEKEGFKIRLKRGGTGSGGSDEGQTALTLPAGAMLLPQALPAAAPVPVALPPSSAGSGPAEQDIKSPMIGTFYRAPSPESAPYVEVGSEVNPDTVVCIIEAMKVMNEIKAEVRGVITQTVMDNAKPVEFGQPLFKIRPL